MYYLLTLKVWGSLGFIFLSQSITAFKKRLGTTCGKNGEKEVCFNRK